MHWLHFLIIATETVRLPPENPQYLLQGQCGSCYVFSGTVAIESRLLIQKGLLASKTPQLALSRQLSVREHLLSGIR